MRVFLAPMLSLLFFILLSLVDLYRAKFMIKKYLAGALDSKSDVKYKVEIPVLGASYLLIGWVP